MSYSNQKITNWGCSSVGRASALHAEGRRFKSSQLHQLYTYIMAIWYMRLLEEGMIEFEQQLSTFTEGKKRAEVYLHEKGHGCRFFDNNSWICDELYENKSETYAENAAENFCLGIKEVKSEEIGKGR